MFNSSYFPGIDTDDEFPFPLPLPELAEQLADRGHEALLVDLGRFPDKSNRRALPHDIPYFLQ